MRHNIARNASERRIYPRVPCRVPLQVRLAGESVAAEVTNLSAQGMFVRPGAMTIKESLRLTVTVGAKRSLVLRVRLAGHAEPCQATGRVAWRSDLGVGIEFLDVGEPLRQFIERLMAAGGDATALLEAVEPELILDVA